MVTGRRAFAGENVHETLSRILSKEQPSLREVNKALPLKLEWIVNKCLAKEAVRRYQHADDLGVDLRSVSTDAEVRAPAPEVGVVAQAPLWDGTTRIAAVIIAALAMVAGGSAVGGFMNRPETASPGSTKRFTLELSAIDRLVDVALALSPDGRDLVYTGGREGSLSLSLYRRQMNSLDAVEIPGTEGAVGPFFSPDGAWVGFFSNGQLKRVQLSGGSPILICDTESFLGGSWGLNGTIVFAQSSGLARVPTSGGTPQPLTAVSLESGESRHPDPFFLPDGRHVLFTVESAESSQIHILDLATAEHSELLRGRDAEYAASGHLVYLAADSLIGTLFAVPFDLEMLLITGDPLPVVEDVQFDAADDPSNAAIANDGTLVYIPTARREMTLVWVTRDGKVTPASDEVARYRYPSLAPDGTRVAVSVTTSASRDIWVHDLVRGGKTKVTTGADAIYPTWNREGTHVTFTSGGTMYEVPADGSAAPSAILERERAQFPMLWSPDGAITFTENEDIWVLPPDGEPVVFVQTPRIDTTAMFSPDGHWIAYVSREADRDDVYVQEYPGPGPKWTISTDGGRAPRWSADGEELFYRLEDRMMVVNVRTEPTFSASTPEVLFSGEFSPPSGGGNPYYDVAPDGERFLMLVDPAGSDIRVIINWFEELKQRVPTGR